MPDDEIYLDPQTVSNGVADWDASAQTLAASWAAKMGAIKGLHGAAPWGPDSAGEAFLASYDKMGAQTFETDAEPLMTQDAQLAGKVKTAAELTMGADTVQAGQVDIDVQGL